MGRRWGGVGGDGEAMGRNGEVTGINGDVIGDKEMGVKGLGRGISYVRGMGRNGY